jgi:NAD-dependent dihydropyrimidine dehydrogenase PreA subunit
MSGIAIITEACIDVKDRACVDVCPVQCIYEYNPAPSPLFSQEVAGSGVIENPSDPNKGHNHTFFIQHSRDVFAG